MLYEVGDEIEVNGKPDDNRLYYYGGTIQKLFDRTAEIKYIDLKSENGEALVEKWGDVVDVWVEDRWIRARFIEHVGRENAVCLLFRPDKEEMHYCEKRHVRTSFSWCVHDGVVVWSFTKMIYRPDGEEGEQYVFSLRCNVRSAQQWRLKDAVSVWKHRRLL
ncbi:hypothetical protein LXL04_038295 [Taraxacum kok-saghyz]